MMFVARQLGWMAFSALLIAGCGGTTTDGQGSATDELRVSKGKGVCDPRVCPPPERFDTKKCECVKPVCDPLVCPAPEYWDENLCECVKPVCDPIVCKKPLVWNPELCACIRPPATL